MSAHDPIFTLDLPGDEPQPRDVVVQFPTPADPAPAESGEVEETSTRPALRERLQPAVERFATGWRAAWVGDGILGMRPRPVADLVRQFWTAPPPYIRDALILRIPYAIYGTPVIAATAAAHLLLLVISYPSLLAGTVLIVVFISLFM